MIQPLLSIVIANYNYGRFIEAAIKSIVDQKLGDKIEIVVVDGGSADNSVEVIKKYEEHISWWVSEKDKGQSDAFNKGFAHARGKYGCWLNADDVFMPWVLRKVISYLESHPRCEWLSGSTVFTTEELKIWRCSRCVELIDWLGDYRPAAPVNGPSSFFLLENFRSVGGFDVADHYSMDVDLWRRFMRRHIKLEMIKDYVWCFRLHDSSKTACSITEHTMRDGAAEEADRVNLRYGISRKMRRVADKINKCQRLLTGAYLWSYLDTMRYKGKSIGDYVFYGNNRGFVCMAMRSMRHRVWSIIYRLGIGNLLTDEWYVRLLYFFRMGRRLDLSNPKDYNAKIQWMKLHYRNPLLVICADKWLARDYVEGKVGPKYLNSIIGVYDDAESIPFEDLPNKFVLKLNHGSGWNIVCEDKSVFNIPAAVKKLNKWLHSDFTRVGREWQYGQIRPKIICETFLEDEAQPILRDYRLFTFDGVVKSIWVDYFKEDGKGRLKKFRNVYDADWNFVLGCGSLFPNGDANDVKRPECLEELLKVASVLCSPFPHCRADFYILDEKKIVFGEMTFSCGNGVNELFPSAYAYRLGEYYKLPMGC